MIYMILHHSHKYDQVMVHELIARSVVQYSNSVVLIIPSTTPVPEHVLQHRIIQALELNHLLLGRRRPTPDVVARLGGEVEHGQVAAHGVGRAVVGPCGLLGCVEGAKPFADALPAGVADLRRELAGRAAAHPAVLGALASAILPGLITPSAATLHYLVIY